MRPVRRVDSVCCQQPVSCRAALGDCIVKLFALKVPTGRGALRPCQACLEFSCSAQPAVYCRALLLNWIIDLLGMSVALHVFQAMDLHAPVGDLSKCFVHACLQSEAPRWLAASASCQLCYNVTHFWAPTAAAQASTVIHLAKLLGARAHGYRGQDAQRSRLVTHIAHPTMLCRALAFMREPFVESDKMQQAREQTHNG